MAETIDVNPGDRPRKSDAAQGPLWGRRVLTLFIALAAIGGFVAVVVYSYDSGKSPGTDAGAPVITAQEGPTKVRPEDPGGMAVPNRDKQIYGRLNAAEKPAGAERLLPPPETVVAKPEKDGDAAKITAMAEKQMAKTAERLAAIAPSTGNADMSPPPPPAAAPSARIAAVTPTRPPRTPPAEKASPAPPRVAKLAATPTKKGAAGYGIQIASLRSQDDAERAWNRLSKQHKDLFGKLESNIVRVDLKGKGIFYRLQAGPLADRPSAKSLCSRLKKRKIGCLVVRR